MPPGYFSNHPYQAHYLFFTLVKKLTVRMRKRVLSSMADEVARNGAYLRITSARGFLGRPLHFPVNPPQKSDPLYTDRLLLSLRHSGTTLNVRNGHISGLLNLRPRGRRQARQGTVQATAEMEKNRVSVTQQKPLQSLSSSSVSFAAIELKSPDSCAPVEATGRGVVLVGVPESTIILWVNRHAAVISPAFERIELRPAAVE